MVVSPGQHLGPYEILSLSGAGGMGEVYHARDNIAIAEELEAADGTQQRFDHDQDEKGGTGHGSTI
ncbi:MAG: hypothetical protein IH846_17515 [Acidobacteria bacterium]|nr:hypothetical protein [Acidobacteriota bacterium]